MILTETKELISKINFNDLRNKKVLITGASGLIGVYMVSCLNHILDEYNIKLYAWIRNEVDEKFKMFYEKCEIIQKDITDIKSFSNLPKFDCIIHAAGYGQPNKFLDDKLKTISLNTSSTINLFDKLNKDGKFLFVSSSEIYSGLDCENILETEIGTTNPNHPRACYIEGKRCGEAICNSFISKGFDVKIVRLSLAYGPGTKKNDNRVLNSLIEKGLTQDYIKLLDNGTAVRTYCYITDVVEMFWNVLLFGKESLYNIGGKSVTSILELAELIAKNLDKKVLLPEIEEQLAGNPKIVNISLQKYLNEFNKNTFVSLEDGIKKTINWQKYIYYNGY